MVPLAAMMVLYYLAGRSGASQSAGQFVGFLATFQTFLAMTLEASQALLRLLGARLPSPLYGQLQAHLQTHLQAKLQSRTEPGAGRTPP